ncbi:tetratricopeptide repeat protein [Cupriavidus plantarum]|uniref:tetratricopeptide repeat protein n=2 Tax=Cupriavidus plantarum TaxID=942865 RepID=UPI000EABA159|nr:tetratricopeptide repeat protein [Cupriavidus plantarum]
MDAYSMRDVQALLGISRTVVTALIAAGVVAPRRGPRREYRFTFQDVVLLRTAQSLRASHVPTRHITRSLRRLQELGQQGRPPTGLRVAAAGRDVTVRDRQGQWQVDTGQFVLDFDARQERSQAGEGKVLVLERSGARDEGVAYGPAGRSPGAPHGLPRGLPRGEGHDPASGSCAPPDIAELAGADRLDPASEFARGVELEEHAPDEARVAYARAIASDPAFPDAYLNLGCLLCDGGCFEEAILLYRAALQRLPDHPVLHFNLGVALEDAGAPRDALASYHACIDLAPDFADAHYNAARLHEALGDPHRAIRHYNQYRKLEPAI